MSRIYSSASVDAIKVNKTTVLPVVLPDEDPAKGKLIYNNAANSLCYADGTQWVNVASGGDITQLQTDVTQLQTDVTQLQTDVTQMSQSGVVLINANVNFPNGSVLTAGSNIDIISNVGSISVGVAQTSAIVVINYDSFPTSGKSLQLTWTFVKIGNIVTASIDQAISTGTTGVPFPSYHSSTQIPVIMRPASSPLYPILINTVGSPPAAELGSMYINTTPLNGDTRISMAEPGSNFPTSTGDAIYGTSFTWFTA